MRSQHSAYLRDLLLVATSFALSPFGDCFNKLEALLQLISRNALKNFSDSLPYRRSILEQQIEVTWEDTQNQPKESYREVNLLIGERTEPAYSTCSRKSNFGALAPMRDQFLQHITQNGKAMYEDSAKLLSSGLGTAIGSGR
ncbi:hypothetical protein ACMFMG_009359 [Clarireedia jacksonii]